MGGLFSGTKRAGMNWLAAFGRRDDADWTPSSTDLMSGNSLVSAEQWSTSGPSPSPEDGGILWVFLGVMVGYFLLRHLFILP